ncbi:hypothetical protein K438DRAFT_1542043, partial [Mycena galopus ATCC 62051]
LGETVLGYWRRYITLAEAGALTNSGLPMPDDWSGDLEATTQDLSVEVPAPNGPVWLPDVRKINILNRRMIVSRKRTRNLFDLTNLWKNTVLLQLDDD